MTPQQHIAKLEALLKRVQTRRAEPRHARAPQKPVAAEAAPVAAPARGTVTLQSEVRSSEFAVAKAPPAPVREAPKASKEPPKEIAEVDLDALPAPPPAIEVQRPAAFVKSDERIKAAAPVVAIGDEESPDELAAASDEQDKEAVTELDAISASDEGEILEVDVAEPAPLSSRRPVALERDANEEMRQEKKNLAELAFGEEQPAPPRHTPPPESGKLPAAPTVEFDGDITGVREAAKLGPGAEAARAAADALVAKTDVDAVVSPPPALARAPEVAPKPEETQPMPLAPPRAAPAPAKALTPEVARPVIEPTAPAVDFIGEALAFKPKTFGELLDASLAL